MNRFLDSWQHHTVTTSAGEVTFTVFPGPPPFVGCTFLGDKPIAPGEARQLLEDASHDGATLTYMGENWADHVGERRG